MQVCDCTCRECTVTLFVVVVCYTFGVCSFFIFHFLAIDACARCQGDIKQQMEALKIAFAILKSIQMEPDIEPNHVTYGTVLKATVFLLPAGEERNRVALALFEKARTAGMIDMNMIKNMRMAVDSHVMQELFADITTDRQGHINYNNIPPAWSRNVRY